MRLTVGSVYCAEYHLGLAKTRLGFVEDELECPTWMLGVWYKMDLHRELPRLKKRIRELESEVALGYMVNEEEQDV